MIVRIYTEKYLNSYICNKNRNFGSLSPQKKVSNLSICCKYYAELYIKLILFKNPIQCLFKKCMQNIKLSRVSIKR